MYTFYIVLVVIIILFGFLGGLINYFNKPRQEDKDLNGREFWKSIITGVGASFLVPLFLNMISSNLIIESMKSPYQLLVIGGFCLIASISAKPFIDSMTDKVVKQIQEDHKELKREVSAVAKEVDSVVGTQTEFEEVDAVREVSAIHGEMHEIEKDEKLQKLRIYKKDEADVRVIKALGNDEAYKYRTESGIAKSTRIDAAELPDVLDKLIKRNYIGSITKEEKKLFFLTPMGRALLYEKNKYVEGEISEIQEKGEKNNKFVYKVVLNNNYSINIYTFEKELPYKKGDRICAVTVDGYNVDVSYVNGLV